MNVAVDHGADENLNFCNYVDYFIEEQLLPYVAQGWVDRIRKKGNEAVHEIKPVQKGEAEELVSFCAMLLKNVYEFPHLGGSVPQGDKGTGGAAQDSPESSKPPPAEDK